MIKATGGERVRGGGGMLHAPAPDDTNTTANQNRLFTGHMLGEERERVCVCAGVYSSSYLS